MKVPKLDDDFMRYTRELQADMRRRARKQYAKDHIFDIINSVIAVTALIVAIIALFYP